MLSKITKLYVNPCYYLDVAQRKSARQRVLFKTKNHIILIGSFEQSEEELAEQMGRDTSSSRGTGDYNYPWLLHSVVLSEIKTTIPRTMPIIRSYSSMWLLEMLLILWDQVRLSKERKKGDKIVSDSQERAFWRVHRPPPGCLSSLEVVLVPTRFHPGLTRPSSRKRTLTDLQREVTEITVHLQHALCRQSWFLKCARIISFSGCSSTEQFDTHENKGFNCYRKFEIILRHARRIRSDVCTAATFQSMDHRRSHVLATE